MKYHQCILSRTLMVCTMLIGGFLATLSQEPTWTGQVQCQLSVQLNGLTHQETQTWKLTGAAPTMSGAIAVYPAVWSVSGEGTAQRTVNNQVVSGLWKTNVAPTSTNLGFFVRASDNRLVIKSYHAQLYAPSAIVGTQQLTVAGAVPTQRTVQNAAYEWQLPVIEDSATSASVSGSANVSVSGNVVSLQATPSETANCTWQFTKGSAVPTPQTQLTSVPRVIQPTATVVAQLPTLNRGASASAGAAGAAGATAGAGAAGGGSSSAGAGAAVVPGTQGAAGGAAAGAAGQNSAGAGGAAAATGSAINYAGNLSGSAAAGSAAAGAGGAAGAFVGGSAAGGAPGSAAGASGNSSAATTGGSSGSTNLTRGSLQQSPLQVTLVPTIAQVTPNYVAFGHIVPVTITGSFTHFAQGLTSVSFGAPTLITVTSVKVDSPTSLTASVSTAFALPPGVQFSGVKCDLTVVTSTPPASSTQQYTPVSADEVVTLAGAFWVTPPALPQHNTLATFSPNTGQQGQAMTVTITGTDTNFVQGVTQIKENPLSPIKGASLTVTSPTTAIANFTIPATAVTRTSQNTLVVETNTGQMVETTLGEFTIAPMPDSYSHGPHPTSGVDISTTTPQTFDGQLASLSGEDWFWLECDISACNVSLQNVTAPTNIVVDLLDANQVPVAPSVQQSNPPTKVEGAGAFYFLRVRATAWDVSQPKYTLVVTGISQ